MIIHQIIFSPTGGTQRVSEILCQGIGKESIVTDLCVKAADIQLPDIQEDDLAVIAMPVFAGRVPALAVERLRMVKPNSVKCVVVAVFGNRAYDDALLEMQDVASEIGFRVIAAVAAVADIVSLGNTAKADPMLTMSRCSVDSVQTSCARQNVMTARCRRCLAIVHTKKEVKYPNLKEDVAATVVAFVPRTVLLMPFRCPTLKQLTRPSVYPA